MHAVGYCPFIVYFVRVNAAPADVDGKGVGFSTEYAALAGCGGGFIIEITAVFSGLR